MARTKEFDVDAVLDRAVDLFRSQGLSATSVQDLVDHLGINRGSIYDTFQSKEHLYDLALERYVEEGRTFVDATLGLELPLRERLETMLLALTESAQGRGCLVVNTACERNDRDPASQATTRSAFDITRQQFRQAFAAAHANEKRADVDDDTAAETILVLAQGLMVMATTGDDHRTLGPVIDATLDRVTAPGTAS